MDKEKKQQVVDKIDKILEEDGIPYKSATIDMEDLQIVAQCMEVYAEHTMEWIEDSIKAQNVVFETLESGVAVLRRLDTTLTKIYELFDVDEQARADIEVDYFQAKVDEYAEGLAARSTEAIH